MRYLAYTLIAVATASLVLWLFAMFVRRTGLFYPAKYPAGVWDKSAFGIEPKDVEFTTEDGVKIHAWLIESTTPDAPLLVHFHGNGANITVRVAPAEALARNGISVLLFDYRGYGKSEGRPSEKGLFLDSEAAYRAALQIQNDPSRIVLYGESLGGPYAAWIARKQPVCGVILEGSFPSVNRTANVLYRPIPMGLFAGGGLTTTDWLNDAGKPVLILHARHDRVLPFELGQDIHDKLRTPKRLVPFERGQHSVLYDAEPQLYVGSILQFVREYCGS